MTSYLRSAKAVAISWLLVVVLVPLAGLMQVPAGAQPADDDTEPSNRLDVVGTFRRFPSDLESVLGETPKANPTAGGIKHGGWPFLDVDNRRVFQLYELEAGGIGITIRHLNSLRGAGAIKIPEYKSLGFPHFPDTFPDANVEVDQSGRRLFLWTGNWNNQGSAGIVVVEWDKPRPRYRFTEVPATDGQMNQSGTHVAVYVSGLTYESAERKLYVRTELDPTNALGLNVMGIVQIDAAQDDPTAVKVDWARRLRACRSGPTFGIANHAGATGVLWVKEERSLYIPCNPGAATGIVRVPVSEAGLPITEETFGGIGFALDYVIDRPAERVHIKTTSGPSGLAVLTFDARQKAYVGLSALQDPPPDAVNAREMATPMAVDETTGRVYALSDSPKYGLTFIDGRLSPVPPGLQFPQVRHIPGAYAPPAIRFDPRTRRIFVPRRQSQNVTGDFLILKDSAPAGSSEFFDVDTLTTDTPENEGVTTQADYSGGASGYGLRILLAGGARGVPPVSFFEGIPSDYGKSPCRATDRDLIFGRVDRAFLSTAGRTASSIAGDADVATRSDLGEPSRCKDTRPARDLDNSAAGPTLNNPNVQALMDLLTNPVYDQADAAGQTWAFRRTECPVPNDDGTTMTKDEAIGEPPFTSSSSSVDCLPEKAQLVASSTARLPLPGAPVTFGDTGSFTEVVRDPKRGLVSRAIAYVRDVDIGGVVQIDGVYAVAESLATGRPEKSNKIGARTTYIRSVSGFTSPGFSCGHQGEDSCGDPSALVDAVNRAFASGGVQLRFPPLEPKLAEGTPGGYQAGVQREFFNSLNAEFANGDILKEVPALEIVRTNDSKNWGRQRQIYQFAGVLVNSQYGISSLTAGVDSPLPPDGSTDPVPPDEQVLGDAVTGLVPSVPTLGPSSPTTSSSPAQPPLLAAPPATDNGFVSLPEIGRRITQGLGFLARNPKTAGLMVGAWILLLLPGALAYRRRLLLNAVTSSGGGSS